MRTDRIAKRWNLKSRARAGRFLQHWQQRLTDSAHRLYEAGYLDAQLQGGSAVSQAHGDGQGMRDPEGGQPAQDPHDRQRELHAAVPHQEGLVESR